MEGEAHPINHGIYNAEIRKAEIWTTVGLGAQIAVYARFGNGGELSFDYSAHEGDLSGWICKLLDAAGTYNWTKLVGRAVRVRVGPVKAAGELIEAITDVGHITRGDKWFHVWNGEGTSEAPLKSAAKSP